VTNGLNTVEFRLNRMVDGGGESGWLSGRAGTVLNVRCFVLVLVVFVTAMIIMSLQVTPSCVNTPESLSDWQSSLQRLHQEQLTQTGTLINILEQIKSRHNSTKDVDAKSTSTDTDTSQKWNYNWDMKQWANKEEAVGVGTRTIILVRHGKYDYDTGKLTDQGRQQVNLTGYRLKELGMQYRVITHSPMIRAQETAEIIHTHLPHLPTYQDAILEEGGPIQPEPTISYWSLPQRDYFVNGPRMESAFRKYFFRADKSQTEQTFEIIVGHGNLFRYFILRAMQFPASGWMRTFIAHASISMLHLNPDGTVSMTRFGDSGHFPPDLVTY